MSSAGLPANYTGSVTVAPKRSIGGITADATIEEGHADRLAITEHPVQQGAAITDHAYKKPAQVTIHIGFSNSSRQANGNEAYINDTYSKFLQLQSGRELLDVYTARRTYQDMLIESLSLTTNEDTENAMILTVALQQLILVSTQTVTVPAAQQKSPQKTGSVVNTGTKQAKPVINPPAAVNTVGATGIPFSQNLTPLN